MVDQDIFLFSITLIKNTAVLFLIKAYIQLEMVNLKTNCQSVKGSLAVEKLRP